MAQFSTAKIVVRQGSWWFSTLIFQTQKKGWKTHLHVFPYWQSSGVSKTSPLNHDCRSSKLVLCTCRLQLASGSAFLREQWTLIHAFSLKQLCSPAVQEGKSWLCGTLEASKSGLAQLLDVFCRSQLILLLGHCRKPRSSHSPSAISAFRPSVHVAQGLLAVFSLHRSYKIKQWHRFLNILWGIVQDFEMP